MLKVANNRADYAQILEKNGYRISSINTDKKTSWSTRWSRATNPHPG